MGINQTHCHDGFHRVFCLVFVYDGFCISDFAQFLHIRFYVQIFSTDFSFWFLLCAISLVYTLNNQRIQQVSFQLFT